MKEDDRTTNASTPSTTKVGKQTLKDQPKHSGNTGIVKRELIEAIKNCSDNTVEEVVEQLEKLIEPVEDPQ